MVTPLEGFQMAEIGSNILGSVFGGGGNSIGRRSKDINRLEYERYMREDKWGGVGQRVRQAKKAGLHLLFALGATTGSSPSFGIPGQSQSGSHKRDALAGLGDAFGSIAQMLAAKDLVEAQSKASELERNVNLLQNDDTTLITPNYGPTKRGMPPLKTRVRPSERREREAVDMKGRTGVIPRGTPQEDLEGEFGEWADWLPQNLQRVWKYLQNTDWVPSENDIKDIVRNPYLLQRKAAEHKRRGPRHVPRNKKRSRSTIRGRRY